MCVSEARTRSAFARSDLFLKGLQGVAAPACAVVGISTSAAYSFDLLFAAHLAAKHLKGGSQWHYLVLLYTNIIWIEILHAEGVCGSV